MYPMKKKRCESTDFTSSQVISLNAFFSVTESQAQSVPEPNEIGNVIQEVVDFERQINLEVKSDDVQELLDLRNQMTIDELLEVHEQDILSSNPVQSEDRMTVGNLTEGLNLIEKGLQSLENIGLQRKAYFFNKAMKKKTINPLLRNFADEKKNYLSRQTNLLYFMKPSTSK
ncbi:tigger transposable element-derived protein 1 [Trichonephila clavipes]|nr:tigger transposable element-derived protein 1 [Trichonephila clavipes]